ncbi:hypothetical protein RIF29_28554 [Crotalaria pallida]|uniref:Uncharacterized protein n=1 Tax=Crotalaria pallida TaxID=3830 RepID=A0AAN9EI55_CROPI
MSFARRSWFLRFSERFKFLQQTRSFCTNNNTNIPKTTSTNPPKQNDVVPDERYKQLENLDMMTAAKILFNDGTPKKKKFGCIFGGTEVAKKRKKIEEEEAKALEKEEEAKALEKEEEAELDPIEVKEANSNPQLLEVKERLNKLEEAVKEIVVLSKNQVTGTEKKQLSSSAPSETNNSSAPNRVVEGDCFSEHNSPKPKPELGEERKGSLATAKSSLQDSQGQHQGGGGAS